MTATVILYVTVANCEVDIVLVWFAFLLFLKNVPGPGAYNIAGSLGRKATSDVEPLCTVPFGTQSRVSTGTCWNCFYAIPFRNWLNTTNVM